MNRTFPDTGFERCIMYVSRKTIDFFLWNFQEGVCKQTLFSGSDTCKTQDPGVMLFSKMKKSKNWHFLIFVKIRKIVIFKVASLKKTSPLYCREMVCDKYLLVVCQDNFNPPRHQSVTFNFLRHPSLVVVIYSGSTESVTDKCIIPLNFTLL